MPGTTRWRTIVRFLIVTVVCAALAACAARQAPRPVLPEGVPADVAVLLDSTPFFPQRAHHCGPAALATVLVATGVEVHPDALAPLLYVPGRRGSFQVELAAVPRRFERLAVQVDGTLDAIVTQLALGRPVLVLQNLGLERWPRWHYAVVIGYDPRTDEFVLRSGTEARQQVATSRFLATWIRGGRWGLVVLEPHVPPTGLTASAYLKAAAATESAGHHEAALAAFDAALTVWPDEPTVLLGRANNLYHLGQRAAAAAGYQALLERVPDHPVALHNRAQLALEDAGPCAALPLLPPVRPGEHALVTTARAAALARPGAADCVTR